VQLLEPLGNAHIGRAARQSPVVAANFDAAALRANILDSQQGGQSWRDFSIRAMAGGVQGYFAFLRGQGGTYFGRQGDQHTEWFPEAKP
jgi:hypothetical protein